MAFSPVATPQDAFRGRPLDVVLLGGLLGSMFSFLQFLVSPIIGQLSDRFGRKLVLLLSMIGNIASCLLWAFSWKFSIFALSRIIGGLSEGNVQLSIAIISDVTDQTGRSRALALVGIAFATGFTVGPALGAYFASIDLRESFPFLVDYIGLNPYATTAILASLLVIVESIYLLWKLPETAPGLSNSSQISPIKEATKNVARKRINLSKYNMLHLAYLILFSGMEFTITFLTFDVFQFTNMQQGRLLGFIGILSALIQGGYVRRKRKGYVGLNANLQGELSQVRLGIQASIMGLAAIALAVWQEHQFFLWVGAVGLAIASGTVVNGMTTMVSLLCDSQATNSENKDGTTMESLEMAKGLILGEFRSSGQFGRAVGPLFACSIYWWAGPVICYGGGALGMVAVLISTQTVRNILEKEE